MWKEVAASLRQQSALFSLGKSAPTGRHARSCAVTSRQRQSWPDGLNTKDWLILYKKYSYNERVLSYVSLSSMRHNGSLAFPPDSSLPVIIPARKLSAPTLIAVPLGRPKTT